MDQTQTQDYNRLVSEELEHDSDIAVTDGLAEVCGIYAKKAV
jgi:hypothetical protein